MKISVYQINELRKITGVGIMDCRKALINSNGNIDEAILFLRKKGEKIAKSRSSFRIKDGAVLSTISSDYSCGTIIGISCETDFLSKSSEFLSFLSMLSKKSLSHHTKNNFLNSFCHENNSMQESVREMIIRKMGVVGEKLELKIFEKIDSPFVIDYTHNNHKIATLVGFSSELNISVARNIAMHITAMNPIAINEEQIPDVIMKKEIYIIENQVKKEIKSCDMIKKIIQGKIQKFVQNNTLMNQKFIKDNKINIQEYLNKHNKNIKINFFKRVDI